MAELLQISRALGRAVSKLEFGEPVTHVYNPLRYAKRPHELYLSRFGAGPKEAVLVGMNPGPFGMGQTGVPFGDVGFVRDWMGIEAPVARPPSLWGWAKERFGTPERFFSRFFVINYCPLLFMESTGRNRTPDKLSAAERFALLSACDEALRAAVEVLDPKLVVGVGAWATKRALGALGHDGPAIGTVLHPSPASPKANRGWAPQAESDLRSLGIKL
jgi:single-strand selective monofunctional uracil DNA glycosylase